MHATFFFSLSFFARTCSVAERLECFVSLNRSSTQRGEQSDGCGDDGRDFQTRPNQPLCASALKRRRKKCGGNVRF